MIFFSKLVTPGLTTMHQPFQQMGRDGAESIINMAKSGNNDRVVKCYTPELITRASTKVYTA